MSAKVLLAINVDVQKDAYRAMAGRSRRLQITDDLESCAAVVTDDPDMALQLADKGKHVLLTNPFSVAADVSLKLASVPNVVPAHAARHQPSIAAVGHTLDAGNLGQPGLLRIHRWRHGTELNDQSLATELDLALWLFGETPAEIYSASRPNYFHIHVGFPGGGMAIIDLDNGIPAHNSYYSLSLIGSTGAAYADDHRNQNLMLGSGGTRALAIRPSDLSLLGLLEEFAESIQEEQEFSTTWDQTQQALRVAKQARTSADKHQVVKMGDSDV